MIAQASNSNILSKSNIAQQFDSFNKHVENLDTFGFEENTLKMSAYEFNPYFSLSLKDS